MRKAYPRYKKSQRPSFGNIPNDWKEKRFGYLFSFGKGLSITKENLVDEGVPCINYGEIHSRYGFEVSPEKHQLKCVSENYLDTSKNALLNHGDFIFADTSEDLEGSGNFTYYNSTATAFAGYHTILNKPKKPNNNCRFLAYLFDSNSFRAQIQQEVTGTKVFSITKSILKDTMVLLPPIDEQNSIVSFLDKKISAIHELIAKRNVFIERLKEKQTALISQVVTKGLPPSEAKKHGLLESPKMKPSGVDWLGDIPQHWKVFRLKNLIKSKLMYGANEPAELDDPNLPRYIRITDFGDDGKLRGDTFRSLPIEIAKDYYLSDGDILFARSGATVGKTFQYKGENQKACFAGYLIKASPNSNIVTSDFLYIFTKSSNYESWKNSIFSQATIQNIGADKYQNLVIAIPPMKEQEKINSYLQVENGRIELLVKKVELAIDKLKEYRSTLITAAITGKIDVRDFDKNLKEK